MSDFFEQLKKEGGVVRMSDAEKSRMRTAIFGLPAGKASAPSPYFSFFAISTLLNLRGAVVLLLIFGIVGSSTAYAAQGALPGDVLYPVKVSVNERVEVAFATTPQEKMEAEVRLAKRRVAEAQALDAEGRLDVVLTSEIEREFDRHAQNALALVTDEEKESEPQEQIQPTSTKPETFELKVAVSVMMEDATSSDAATGSAEATATAQMTKTEEDSNIQATLEEQKQVLKALRIRIESRGEVRGASSEHRKDKKNQDND